MATYNRLYYVLPGTNREHSILVGECLMTLCAHRLGMHLIESALEHLWYEHELSSGGLFQPYRDDLRAAIYILEENRLALAEEYETAKTNYRENGIE